MTRRPENLLKTLVNIVKCLRTDFLKNISEPVNQSGSCFFEFQVKNYRTVVQKFCRHVDMNVNKLISLENTT